MVGRTLDLVVRLEFTESGDIVKSEEWLLDGQLHNPLGPALVIRDPTSGIVTAEQWCLNGRNHREDGPASIQYDPTTGCAVNEIWIQNGLVHRSDDLPALIRRTPDGETTELRYDVQNLTHVMYDPDTRIRTYEGWYHRGAMHRDDGPAEITRSANTGRIKSKRFFQSGRQVPSLNNAPRHNPN